MHHFTSITKLAISSHVLVHEAFPFVWLVKIVITLRRSSTCALILKFQRSTIAHSCLNPWPRLFVILLLVQADAKGGDESQVDVGRNRDEVLEESLGMKF
jgi:hypothetical protein